MKNTYLGLDVSTSYVGVSLLDVDGSVLLLDHIDLTKKKTMWEKADAVKQFLASADLGNLNKVFIEDAAKRFAAGRSSAQVIATLLRFNGIVSFITWELFNMAPVYIAPSAARKTIGLKMQQSKKCGLSHKEQTFQAVMGTDLGHVTWPTKKNGIDVVPWAYDIVDAYVIAKAGRQLEQTVGLG